MNRFFILLIVASLACSSLGIVEAQVRGDAARAPAWVPPSGPSPKDTHWQLGTFRSETAGANVGYYCYLPPGYERDKDERYPVIYWLHGLNGSPASARPVVTRLDEAIKSSAAPEAILISCTDPTRRSMWTDSKDGTVPIETVIVTELIPHVAACTAVIPGFEAEGEDAAVSAKPNLLVLYNPVLDCVSIGRRFGIGDIARKISPNHHLTQGIPATIIFFGTKDRLNEGGKAFIEKAATLGIRAEMYMAPDQQHAFFNRAPWLQRTIYLTDEFLARQGYIQGKPTMNLPAGRLDMPRWKQ